MSSQWACCELSVSLVSHTVSFLWSFCEFANCTQARHKRFSHLELFSQTSNNCSLKTVMLCLMFANIYEQWTTMLRKLCSGWGSPCEHGVSFLWLNILQQYDISLLHKPVARYVIEWGGVCFSHKSGLFFVLFGRNWNLCAYYGKKIHFFALLEKIDFFAHWPHCQGQLPWENFFWKIWLKIMHLDTLWSNYIPILILMIKTCSSHLQLPWTPNKPIRWAENTTSWIPHGWMREFNATFA